MLHLDGGGLACPSTLCSLKCFRAKRLSSSFTLEISGAQHLTLSNVLAPSEKQITSMKSKLLVILGEDCFLLDTAVDT